MMSLARAGKVRQIKNADDLSRSILGGIRRVQASKSSWMRRVASLVTRRWPLKKGALLSVTVLWLVFPGQHDFEVFLRAPLRTRSVPRELEIAKPPRPAWVITVGGLRKDAGTRNDRNVHAEKDMSPATLGFTFQKSQ